MYPEITYTSLINRKSLTLDYASLLNDIKGKDWNLGYTKIKIKSRRPRHIFLHFRMINACFIFTGLSQRSVYVCLRLFINLVLIWTPVRTRRKHRKQKFHANMSTSG